MSALAVAFLLILVLARPTFGGSAAGESALFAVRMTTEPGVLSG